MKKYALVGTRSEIVEINGKFPTTFRKKWSAVAKKFSYSSNFPWLMRDQMEKEGFKISIQLKHYTWGADSTRWYKVTVL